MENTQIFEMADRLKTLQEQKKDLEAQTKALAAEIAELDEQLSDAMTEAELDRFSRNGSTFYLKSRLFASPACRPQGRDDAGSEGQRIRQPGRGDGQRKHARILHQGAAGSHGRRRPGVARRYRKHLRKSVGRHPQVVVAPIHCTNAKTTTNFIS